MPQKGPRYSHASQGTVEQAVKAIEGQVRTLLHRFSALSGEEFRSTDPAVAWAVRHSGLILTNYRVLEHGRTPHRVLTGREDRGQLVELFETVWGRDPTPMATQAKLSTRWQEYLWLGRVESSGEHLLSDGDRLFTTRSIRRLPDGVGAGKRWQPDRVRGLKSLPWGETGESMADDRTICRVM